MELLVVICIIGILTVLALPALKGTNAALQISSASQHFSDTLSLAGQAAHTRNLPVEFRIYQLPDPTNSGGPQIWRGYQGFYMNDDGTYTPLNPVAFLPSGVIFNANGSYSSLITDTAVSTGTASGTVTLPNAGAGTYVSFQFNSNGSLNLNSTPTGGSVWCVTIQGQRDKVVSNNLPANYSVVQIDTLLGTVKVTRP